MPTIIPPWSEAQIAALTAHQQNTRVHPYTCVCSGEVLLVPTRDGWLCPQCDYRQLWAHDPC